MTKFSDQYVMIIDGESVNASNTFEAYNPATKETIANVPAASKEQPVVHGLCPTPGARGGGRPPGR